MSDVICDDCGGLFDQSDMCWHASKCSPPTIVELQAEIRALCKQLDLANALERVETAAIGNNADIEVRVGQLWIHEQDLNPCEVIEPIGCSLPDTWKMRRISDDHIFYMYRRARWEGEWRLKGMKTTADTGNIPEPDAEAYKRKLHEATEAMQKAVGVSAIPRK